MSGSMDHDASAGATDGVPASMDARENDVLAAAERVRAGGDLESVPAEIRADVEGTIAALSSVERLAETASPAFIGSLETSLLAAVDRARGERAGARRGWFSLGMMRLAAVMGAVVLALGWGGFAAVGASEGAIPGDTLYPVKEASEAVRVFFARGDAITRIRIEQLARRQAELEAALARGDGARSVTRLEVKVAVGSAELVNAARRLEAAGNPAPAEATRVAIGRLHQRIDALEAAESRPAVARTLRRMSTYLEGQERELGAAGRPSGGAPAPGGTPTATAPGGATPTATPLGGAAGGAGGTATPTPPRGGLTPLATVLPTAAPDRTSTPAPSATPSATSTPAPEPTRAPSDGTPVPTRTPTPTATREATPVRTN